MPEQIAAERALTVSTVYSHLAQLIADGRVRVDQVVGPKLQAQIRAAIEAVGSVEYLSPIKARLPVDVDYNVIRCVANAWAREHGQVQAPPVKAPDPVELDERATALFERLRAWRLERARADQVAPFVIFHDTVLKHIAAARPHSTAALLALRGVGPAKVAKYGAEILALMADH
jgi:superfamily II DNA helicase RecQ